MLWHLLIYYYQTYAIISPPTLRFLASLSVITPSEVETNAIPKPFNTLGTSLALAYTRKPGLEIRFNPVITRSLF